MEKELKNQVISGIKKSAKIAKESIKNVYDKSLTFMSFMSSSTLFKIEELNDKTKVNKLFYGIFDEKEQVLYIKSKLKNNNDIYFKENSKLKIIGKDEQSYIIDKSDFEETHDYFLKIDSKYVVVSCYKIWLLKI